MLPKPTGPAGCSGCALEHKGIGFSYPTGPISAQVAIIGEALGRYESYVGQAFVGPSGALLNRLLKMLGRERSDLRIHNVCACQPTATNWLDGAPWERAAIQHCRRYLEPVLDEGHKVVVALGNTSMRSLLGLPKGKKINMENFHGYPVRDPTDRFWVVASYHPAFIIGGGEKEQDGKGGELKRKNHRFTGVLLHDLQRAFEIADGGWAPRVPQLVLDPHLDWLRGWVDAYLAVQDTCWLAVDIETADKDTDEDELVIGDDITKPILRINFSCSEEEGITVPWDATYLGEIGRLLSSRGVKVVWSGFDAPILAAHGYPMNGPIYDGMWMFHVLQSDLKKSLGFVAPFYGADRPWKHLSSSEPVLYAAYDGVNEIKCAYGVARDLQAEGMWGVFERHVYQLDKWGLRPAEVVGLACNRSGLERLGADMAKEIARLEAQIKGLVPDAARPIWGPGKAGWAKPPSAKALARIQAEDEMDSLPEIIERQVEMEVLCCKLCGAQDVTRAHKCPKQKGVKSGKRRRKDPSLYGGSSGPATGPS